jgi:hypothetical protein
MDGEATNFGRGADHGFWTDGALMELYYAVEAGSVVGVVPGE